MECFFEVISTCLHLLLPDPEQDTRIGLVHPSRAFSSGNLTSLFLTVCLSPLRLSHPSLSSMCMFISFISHILDSRVYKIIIVSHWPAISIVLEVHICFLSTVVTDRIQLTSFLVFFLSFFFLLYFPRTVALTTVNTDEKVSSSERIFCCWRAYLLAECNLTS